MPCRLFPLVVVVVTCCLHGVDGFSAEITAERSQRGAVVKIDGQLFTEYLVRSGTKPVLWPIIGPSGKPISERAARRYLDAVERYFTGFSAEAGTQLAKLERRLSQVSQLQYNLTAERGVAVKRVAATQGVLATIAELRR